ncbi:MAG: hypothetical protein BTN85_2210 [Candidatus Methanohalarchaeum thermophilum]|uniref:Uncharacterized protein n=1 Tax=Methanohalarchaeum thermophilum TaxID=1903181 RepID=A0A1Q6DRZ2_METT1|nr:MAG: hypothetical protein BTN85_2210 [Candidatus Methanohalarchaeum thermophilum]
MPGLAFSYVIFFIYSIFLNDFVFSLETVFLEPFFNKLIELNLSIFQVGFGGIFLLIAAILSIYLIGIVIHPIRYLTKECFMIQPMSYRVYKYIHKYPSFMPGVLEEFEEINQNLNNKDLNVFQKEDYLSTKKSDSNSRINKKYYSFKSWIDEKFNLSKKFKEKIDLDKIKELEDSYILARRYIQDKKPELFHHYVDRAEGFQNFWSTLIFLSIILLVLSIPIALSKSPSHIKLIYLLFTALILITSLKRFNDFIKVKYRNIFLPTHLTKK